MGLFSYSMREGKGVYENEPKPPKVILFFQILGRKFFSFVKLNLLFLLCSIPIVTIGAAICGMTFVLKNYSEERHSFLASDFFEYFKKCFLKGFLVMLVNGVTLFSLSVVWLNFNIVASFQTLIIPIIVINALLIMMDFYIFPMIVMYDLSFGKIMYNGFLFAIGKLPVSLMIALIWAVLIFILLRLNIFVAGFIILMIIPSLLGFISTFSVLDTIKKSFDEAVAVSKE